MRRRLLCQLLALAALAGTPIAAGAAPGKPTARLPYLVGAAVEDISPDLLGLTVINQGGNGLGDGSVIPEQAVGRGSQGKTERDRIKARAIVIDDGRTVIAIATIETQGVFAAYRNGPYGISDMKARIAKRNPRLPAHQVLIASDHTHGGPDTIGAWGGMPPAYLELMASRTVRAVERAYAARRAARIVEGRSDASDLIYNQSCPEGLNQDKEPVYTGPDVCPTGGKDGFVRVLQARDARNRVVVTYMAFAAHATAGGGSGVHGDWPQYVGDTLAKRYGGVGMAMQGAVGRTQPCRSACSFTDPRNPGYNIEDRKAAITANYTAHVAKALAAAAPVAGAVAGATREIREAVTGPAVVLLFGLGGKVGAKLLRSHDNPWAVGQTVMTIAQVLRIGDILIAGTPGEGYPEIAFGIRDATSGHRDVITLGLANDQLGYLIAPAAYYVPITAQVAVNDNTIFNVSPTIGDHVMCADIALARSIGFGAGGAQWGPYCAPYEAADALGDPIRAIPVGGVVLDD